MGELKPIGSEKLNADEKLKRILELTYYQSPSDSKKSSVIVEQTATGVYGIVKEKDGYYVKRGLNESSLDYIGGLFMKNKNKFSSYGEAFKKAEFLVEQEKLQEATKYVLKTPKPPIPKPQEEAPMPMPTDEVPPSPAVGETPPPAPDEGLPPSPEDEMPPEGQEEDFKKAIQKLSGKLQEKLNTYKEKLESEDYTYVIKMILSAVDFDKLEQSGDLDDILDEFFPEENENGEPGSEDAPSEVGDTTPPAEDELGETDGITALEELINNPFEDEPVVDDSNYYDDEEDEPLDFEDKSARKFAEKDIASEYDDEDEPEGLTPNTEKPSDDESDEELDELLSDMDIQSSVPEENEMEEELPVPEPGSEVSAPESAVKELDIDELNNMVSSSVKETLSKYFEG